METKKKRAWTNAIGEFVLVVLGILLALQIENWNQNRQENKLESILLNELAVNLVTDLEDVELNINILSETLNSSEIVLAFLNGDIPYNDSLATHFGIISRGTIFNKNFSAYESIKSIGVDIIGNDTLRQNITYLYSVRYDFLVSLEEMHHEIMINILFPVIAKQLNTIESWQKAVPLNITEIRESNVLKESIKQNILFVDLQIQEYQRGKNIILNLIKNIEDELAER